jgi:hypothetical protein
MGEASSSDANLPGRSLLVDAKIEDSLSQMVA